MLDGAASSPHPTLRPRPVPTEIIKVDDAVVACDGGDGSLGHPRVWLRTVPQDGAELGVRDLGAQPMVLCPYCSRLYVLNDGAGTDHGH